MSHLGGLGGYGFCSDFHGYLSSGLYGVYGLNTNFLFIYVQTVRVFRVPRAQPLGLKCRGRFSRSAVA